MNSSRLRGSVLAAVCAAGLASGCATPQRPDPLERFNRDVFAFNEAVDKYVIVPPATLYRDLVPLGVRRSVDNFFNNLKDAWSAVNLLLQGRPGDATNDFMRFSVNTVLGIGGVFDVGTEVGLEPHREDFGQTLGRWGVEPGAYLMLPILGPSTLRDAVGLPVDFMASPDQIAETVETRNALTAVRVVNARAGLLGATDLLDDIALDKYTFVRDAYLQRRRNLVYDGEPPEEDGERGDPPGTPAGPSAPASAPAGPASAPALPASAPASAARAPAGAASAPEPTPGASAPGKQP